MSEAKASPTKRLKWRIEWAAHSLLDGVMGLLPVPVAFRIGSVLAGLIWHFIPQRRRVLMRNLRIALQGESDRDKVEQLARECFRRTAAGLVCLAGTARLKPHQISKVLEVANPELMEQAVAKGRGVVLLLSHMGNWELLSRIILLVPPGTKVGGFYRPLNNPLMDRKVLRRREADGSRMFAKSDSFLQASAFLREGGVVGILADQRIGRQGEVVPFFGRLTRTSPLPSLLIRRARSEVIALSLSCMAPGRWRITYLPVEQPYDTRHCMESLNRAMAASLLDVFWLQDRWRPRLVRGKDLVRWLGKENGRSGNPLRVLLWLDGWYSEAALRRRWIHPDVDYELVLGPGRQRPACVSASSPVHPMPEACDTKGITAWLDALDFAKPLPLDVVIAVNPPPGLVAACKRFALRMVVIPCSCGKGKLPLAGGKNS
jgi:Kdo2-lipid IVA lauroyltransferase/acyltransferase